LDLPLPSTCSREYDGQSPDHRKAVAAARQHLEALAEFGYTEREARFLYIIATMALFRYLSGKARLTGTLTPAIPLEYLTHQLPLEGESSWPHKLWGLKRKTLCPLDTHAGWIR
jgi:hypothetical protein